MQKPLGIIDSIAASGSEFIPGVVPFVRARTFSVTIRLNFAAQTSTDAEVYLYYSPDGDRWDTIEYTSWAITASAGNTVQRTVLVDVPEHGHMSIKVTNGDSGDTIDRIICWYSIQSYYDWPAQSRGQIDTADVYD